MRVFAAAAALALVGCGQGATPEERVDTSAQRLIGEQATGSVPSGLPARFMLGLNEGRGGNWMSDSGVPWDMRYQYLSKNWVTNWGHGDYDGKYALDFFYDTYERGMLPAVQFYQIVEEQPAGENMMLTKLGDPATMKSYFGDFKILMERVKDYGGPVVVMVEADGYGFAQIQSGDDPEHYAAVADSGLPELAGLPNTVAGWGLAYLQLKKAVGADNALLGVHVSAWATNYDVMMNNDHVDLETEVDVAYWFLSQLGLTENQTGLTYDFLVGDPSDRDAGYYEKVLAQHRWWDDADDAPITSRSFNRFAEWLRLWNVKSGKRWILWQLPLGNSNHLDVENGGGARQGYRDNRPEYFLANGSAHIQKFADAGTIGLLFGAGMAGMSTYDNDLYTDGQLFMKSRAEAIYAGGGLDVAPGLEWTQGEVSPRPRDDGEPAGAEVDETIPAQYEFEGEGAAGLQGWAFDGPVVSAIEVSAEQAFGGASSLAVRLSGAAGKSKVLVKNPALPAGVAYALVRVYVPAGHALTSLQVYAQQSPASGYAWISSWHDATTLEPDQWHTLVVQIPSDAGAPFTEIGIELAGNAGAATTVYLDSVAWPATGNPPAGGGPNAGGGATPGSGGSAAGTPLPENEPLRSHATSCALSAPGSASGGGALMLALVSLPLLRRRRRRG